MTPGGFPTILPASVRRAVAWKNGGGVTREVAASPDGAGLEDFDWRVSTAEVRVAGPFSLFPGVDRTLSVLAGELWLTTGEPGPVKLSERSAPFSFPGDLPVWGEPHGACVKDLNVMTRRGRYVAHVRRLDGAAAAALTLSAGTSLILALSDLVVRVAGAAFALSRWDAARFTGPARCALSASAGQAACYLIAIDVAAAR